MIESRANQSFHGRVDFSTLESYQEANNEMRRLFYKGGERSGSKVEKLPREFHVPLSWSLKFKGCPRKNKVRLLHDSVPYWLTFAGARNF